MFLDHLGILCPLKDAISMCRLKVSLRDDFNDAISEVVVSSAPLRLGQKQRFIIIHSSVNSNAPLSRIKIVSKLKRGYVCQLVQACIEARHRVGIPKA